jgi:hypothetical protein
MWETMRIYKKLRYVRNHNHQTLGTDDGGLTFLEGLFSREAKEQTVREKGSHQTYLAQSSSCFKILFQSLQG